jgi:hypothetical protein
MWVAVGFWRWMRSWLPALYLWNLVKVVRYSLRVFAVSFFECLGELVEGGFDEGVRLVLFVVVLCGWSLLGWL